MSQHKIEICILKANGLSKKEIFKLMSLSFLKDVILLCILTTVLLFIMITLIKSLYDITGIQMTIQYIIITIGTVFIFNVLPNLVTLLYINRFTPERILRD